MKNNGFSNLTEGSYNSEITDEIQLFNGLLTIHIISLSSAGQNKKLNGPQATICSRFGLVPGSQYSFPQNYAFPTHSSRSGSGPSIVAFLHEVHSDCIASTSRHPAASHLCCCYSIQKQWIPVTLNLMQGRKKISFRTSKGNGGAHLETQSVCCDRLTREIPKLKQQAVIMKLAHQSSHYTAGTLNQSAGKSSSGANTKWSVNYERHHKQGRSAFGFH